MEQKELDDPPLKVGITYNLKKNQKTDDKPVDNDAEYDDISTILAIKKVLESKNCEVTLLEADQNLPLKLQDYKPDIVFNIAEGIFGRGREAQVPALLNFNKIPYTGSDETTLCVALDKALSKRVLSSYGINTPKYRVIFKEQNKLIGRYPLPAIIKPNAEGSSKGISDFCVANTREELSRLALKNIELYKSDMLVEEYISGREFTVGVLGSGEDIKVFLPMEICFINQSQYNIYSYNVKQNYKEYVKYECPAKISKETEAEMIKTAKKIYKALNCKDFARIDFRLSQDGRLYFIEINPLPGLAPGYSDFPMLAQFNGMGYDTLIWNILKSALKRYGIKYKRG